jgi:hypothetical protein
MSCKTLITGTTAHYKIVSEDEDRAHEELKSKEFEIFAVEENNRRRQSKSEYAWLNLPVGDYLFGLKRKAKVDTLIMDCDDSLDQLNNKDEVGNIKFMTREDINDNKIINLSINVVNQSPNPRQYLKGFYNLINLKTIIQGFSTVLLSSLNENITFSDYNCRDPVLIISLPPSMKIITITCLEQGPDFRPEFRITEAASTLINVNDITLEHNGFSHTTNTLTAEQSIGSRRGIEQILDVKTNPDVTALILSSAGHKYTSRPPNRSRGSGKRMDKNLKYIATLKAAATPKEKATKFANDHFWGKIGGMVTKRRRKPLLRNKKRSNKKNK